MNLNNKFIKLNKNNYFKKLKNENLTSLQLLEQCKIDFKEFNLNYNNKIINFNTFLILINNKYEYLLENILSLCNYKIIYYAIENIKNIYNYHIIYDKNYKANIDIIFNELVKQICIKFKIHLYENNKNLNFIGYIKCLIIIDILNINDIILKLNYL